MIKYKDFILKKTPYIGDEIRTDGYYYRYFDCSEGCNCIAVQCFYRNGILLNMGGAALSLEESDEYVRKNFIENNINSIYEYLKWGLFVIEDKTIKFEYYYSSDDITKWTYIREGFVLNDTTFCITSSWRSDGSNFNNQRDIYHFRQFSPKPDSTNKFIK